MTLRTASSCDVVGLGAIVVDQQMFLERIPQEDEKEKATAIRQQVGGPVPTALALLRRFDHSCHFIGPWGDDAAGEVIRKDLTQEGITCSSNCRQPGQASGIAHVWVSRSNGTRTIASHTMNWSNVVLSPADKECLTSCRVLHLDGMGGDVAIDAATLTREAGGMVTLDAGSPKAATAQLIRLAHVISFPQRFSQQFLDTTETVAAIRRIHQMGPETVICTRGSAGATLFDGQEVVEIPAYKVETADSTGAGDVFSGGLIAGMLRENASPALAVRTGAAAAALKCMRLGNRSALPTPGEIDRLVYG